MENPTHSFRQTHLVLQLIEESQIKSKTVMSWNSLKKRGHFLHCILCTKNFLYSKISCSKNMKYFMYSVLNSITEYTYFVHFLHVFKIAESLQCTHKHNLVHMSSLHLALHILLNPGFACWSLTVTTQKANACSPWTPCFFCRMNNTCLKKVYIFFK